MGKAIIVREQKYFNEFKNGVNFTDNLTDFTNNFTGEVMEKQKVRFVLDVSWDFEASASNGVSSDNTTGRLSKTSGSFLTDGFSIGDTVSMVYTDNSGTTTFVFTIDSISSNVMFITVVTGAQPDSTSNGFINSSVVLTGLSSLTALLWEFGLIENADTFNSLNLVTGSSQSYYVAGMDLSGAWFTMQPSGSNKDWITGEIKARPIVGAIGSGQRFEVEHELIIPFYSEGDNFVQYPSFLDGLNSIKYAFNARFRTVLSNPDSEKSFIYDTSSGSVGYYGENLNGFNNIYSIIDTTYQESTTLNSADGIIASGRTLVTVKVASAGTAFVSSGTFGIYVSYQAKQADYTNTTTDFKDNFIYDRELGLINLTTTSGDTFIYQAKAIIVGVDLHISFEIEYTAAQKLFLSTELSNGDAESIIAVSVGDAALSNGNSNRVMLLADHGSYDFNADIPGLIQNTDLNIFTYLDDIDVDPGFSSVEQWVEDGIVAKGSFDLNIDKDALLNSLEFRLIAENANTGDFFTLDSYSFNVIGSTVVNGVQQLNFNESRGYNLALGNRFNNAILTTNAAAVSGGLKNYNFEVGQKISWQDWQFNNNVDSVFYDNSELNNNLNNKASNYSFKEDYNIKMAIYANVSGTSDEGVTGLTDYLLASPSLDINDYDLDGNPSPTWSGVITTLSETTGNDLNGAILTGTDNTILRATWTHSGGPVASVADIKAIHRIEETNQNGYSIDENGDTRANPSNNKLTNKVGDTEVDVYLSSGLVVTECLISGNQLNVNTSYNMSAKLWNTVALFSGKVTSPLSEQKDTSGTIYQKIEA